MSDFSDFVAEVRLTIFEEFPLLKKQAQQIANSYGLGIRVKEVSLSGSFSEARDHEPTENSDIDIKVTYIGDEDPFKVAAVLAGKLHGRFGVYDCHAEQV